MTDIGKQVFDAVKQVRDLFIEIARMLSDCDRLMSEHGWVATGTGSVSGSSASINIANKWLPFAVHRIYTNADFPSITKVIAVVLDDEWKNRVEEPVIVGSTYFSVEEKAVGFHGWDHTWWWLEFTDATPDGKEKTISTKHCNTSEFDRFNEIKLFGCLMVDIMDVDSIKSRVVDVLVGT